MEKRVFTQEEIDSIKAIQDKYNTLGVQLVQLKLALKSAMDYVESLQLEESTIEQQIIETNQQEKELAAMLDEKYGQGSLDLQTGEFTPN
jgi:regulator of replication initiation timing